MTVDGEAFGCVVLTMPEEPTDVYHPGGELYGWTPRGVTRAAMSKHPRYINLAKAYRADRGGKPLGEDADIVMLLGVLTDGRLALVPEVPASHAKYVMEVPQ